MDPFANEPEFQAAMARWRSVVGSPPPAVPEDADCLSTPFQDRLAELAQLAGTAPSDRPVNPPGYELLDELGHGGMGVVYRARDVVLHRDVAVKVLLERYAPASAPARRFAAEGQITGQLQHPGIPAVYQVGTLPDGRPFLAMKLIKGRTLDALLADRPDPTADRGRFVAVFEQVCHAVGYAHAHGIIHRDLKLTNVMVGAYGEVQVMDWGLAKAMTDAAPAPGDESADDTVSLLTEIRSQRGADEATRSGSVLGTPAYMSPEQAIGAVDQIDIRSDVFGLGAVLCAILTGKPPYVGADAESTRQIAARAQLTDAFTRLDGCGAEPELVALCKQCLSAEKADRPADAGKVTAAVVELRAASEERARQAEVERERVAVREAEGRKRRRLAAGLVGVIGLAMAIGTATTYVKYRGEAEQRGIAEDQERDARKAVEEERQAKLREAEYRAKAEKARDRTRDALDAMTSGLTGDSLATQQAITEEQKKFLGEVLTYYQEFAGEQSDDEPSRKRTAAAAYKVGQIHHRLGHKMEAADAFGMARDGYKALADFSGLPEYRQKLAQSHNNLGRALVDLLMFEKAVVEHHAAIELQTKLVADDRANPVYRQELARSHNSLGVVLALLKRPEAEGGYREALRIQMELVKDDLTKPAYRLELATTHNNLGFMLTADLGKREKAEGEYRAALKLQTKLVADDLTNPVYRQELARSYSNLGILLVRHGQRAEAKDEFSKALTIRKNLAADFPAVRMYRWDLSTSHSNMGSLLAELGQRAEAKDEFSKALTIRKNLAAEDAIDPVYRQGLARSYYNLACLYSDASGKEADKKQVGLAAISGGAVVAVASRMEAEQAMVFLHNAMKVGFQNAAQLKNDTTLNPLRDRADFQKLLANLEAKTKPVDVLHPPGSIK